MQDNECLLPKPRRYWIEHWKAVTCLTFNDIYGGDASESGWIPRLAALSLVRQVAKFSALKFSVSISYPTEEDAEEFANLLRQGMSLRPGAAPIEVKPESGSNGVPVRWQVVEGQIVAPPQP